MGKEHKGNESMPPEAIVSALNQEIAGINRLMAVDLEISDDSQERELRLQQLTEQFTTKMHSVTYSFMDLEAQGKSVDIMIRPCISGRRVTPDRIHAMFEQINTYEAAAFTRTADSLLALPARQLPEEMQLWREGDDYILEGVNPQRIYVGRMGVSPYRIFYDTRIGGIARLSVDLPDSNQPHGDPISIPLDWIQIQLHKPNVS